MTIHRRRGGGLRYTVPGGTQAEFQPGARGRVLRNLPGITTKTAMDRAEFDALVRVQEAYLRRIGPDTRFTDATIREMHREWLGGIYEWAGNYRTVELQKGAFKWPPAYLVDRNMSAFSSGLLARHTPCRPAPVGEVARRIAEVHAELLLIHPFREGNGRLARWLADLMALQAGYPAPAYRFEGRARAGLRRDYLAAVTLGYVQDYEALAAFFEQAIAERLEEAT
jgi:cell filamentation protein